MYSYSRYIILTSLLCIATNAYSFDLPEPDYPVGSERVSELNPVFKWDPSDYKGARYDFILFRPGVLGIPNKPVFYKENISKTEFKIPLKLERKTRYIWFVRVRDGKKVTPWKVKKTNMPYVITSPLEMVVAAFWNQVADHSFITE